MSKIIDNAFESMIKNLLEKTGKSLDQWIVIAETAGKTKHGEVVAYLKSEHSLGHGYANLVARRFLEASSGEAPKVADELVEAQYARAKTAIRPIYDRVIATAKAFGADVEIAPKKAYVSLRRKKQFALIQPSTAKRIDLGLNLKDVDPRGRLEVSGSFNAMCSHRVRLEKPDDFDAEVVDWLKRAYDAS